MCLGQTASLSFKVSWYSFRILPSFSIARFRGSRRRTGRFYRLILSYIKLKWERVKAFPPLLLIAALRKCAARALNATTRIWQGLLPAILWRLQMSTTNRRTPPFDIWRDVCSSRELEHLVGFGPTRTKSRAYKARAIGHYATGAYLSKNKCIIKYTNQLTDLHRTSFLKFVINIYSREAVQWLATSMHLQWTTNLSMSNLKRLA